MNATQPLNSPPFVQLRDVMESDLDIFFAQQLDEEANLMAAFAMEDPRDKDAFSTHWARNLSDGSNLNQTILWNGAVAGYVGFFELLGKPSVAYWIGKDFWGRGIATEALVQFLRRVLERPLFARVVSDNRGSIRVLEKSGFVPTGKERGFANARRAEVDELVYRLDGR